MLEAKGVSKTFGGQVVLRAVDLKVAPGEVVGLVGLNGSGKTTLLDILAGKLHPDRGQVQVDGRRLSERERKHAIFRTYQVPRLFYGLSVVENLVLGRWVVGTTTQRVASNTLKLPPEALAGTLSIGQRRRVVLDWVRARIGRAKYFLLDEPAAGADEVLVQQLLDVLLAARSNGCGVLLVEHRESVLRNACDRVLYLSEGVVAAVQDQGPRIEPSEGPSSQQDVTTDIGAVRLTVDNVSIARGGGLVLGGLSFHLAAGEILALTGANGSGKSTVLRAIYGDPSASFTAGRVTLDGEDLLGLPLQKRISKGVQFMPQETTLFPSMTVEEMVRSSVEAVRATLWNQSSIERMWKALPILRRIWSRRCGVLSGGERRIASLARVILLEPSVALLDEPLAGIDIKSRQNVIDAIETLRASGAAVLVAEQEAFVPLLSATRTLRLGPRADTATLAARESRRAS